MRLYETTSTVTQNEAAPLKRYAHTEYGIRIINRMMLFLLVLAVILGVTVYRENPQEALNCVLIMLVLAAGFAIFGRILLKYASAQSYPPGDLSWTYTTWYDGKCFHRLDDDGDEFAWPLRKIRLAWRSGCVLFLCTSSQAIIPINLLHLSETDHKSLYELLEMECSKLVALE